jgi:hypothetical protein
MKVAPRSSRAQSVSRGAGAAWSTFLNAPWFELRIDHRTSFELGRRCCRRTTVVLICSGLRLGGHARASIVVLKVVRSG